MAVLMVIPEDRITTCSGIRVVPTEYFFSWTLDLYQTDPQPPFLCDWLNFVGSLFGLGNPVSQPGGNVTCTAACAAGFIDQPVDRVLIYWPGAFHIPDVTHSYIIFNLFPVVALGTGIHHPRQS